MPLPAGTRPVNYVVVDVDVSVVRNGFNVLPVGVPFNSVFVAVLPAGVSLAIAFGIKQAIPNWVEGRNIRFDECEVETNGCFVTTTGVSATRVILVFGSPASLGVD